MVGPMRIFERDAEDAVTEVGRAFLGQRSRGRPIVDEPVVGRDTRAILSRIMVNNPLSVEIPGVRGQAR